MKNVKKQGYKIIGKVTRHALGRFKKQYGLHASDKQIRRSLRKLLTGSGTCRIKIPRKVVLALGATENSLLGKTIFAEVAEGVVTNIKEIRKKSMEGG